MILLPNLLNTNELQHLYDEVLLRDAWNINHVSIPDKPGYSFPCLTICLKDKIYHPMFYKELLPILNKIKNKAITNHGLILPDKINRIHIVAYYSGCMTNYHTDTDNHNDYSIIGFITPNWKTEMGGELYLKNQKIDYMPGTFVIFPSNTSHKGVPPIQPTPIWRLALNFVLTN
jgi:hypothetical protein